MEIYYESEKETYETTVALKMDTILQNFKNLMNSFKRKKF